MSAATAAVGVALLLAACGSDATTRSGDPAFVQRAAGSVTLRTTVVQGLGRVLTDEQGRVLYMFPPDARSTVSCTGPCAGTWPPVAIETGRAARAADGARPAELGRLPDPNTGGDIVTYGGHPLYRYAGDVSPGTANGQALNLNGGPWYVLNVAGVPLTTAIGRR